MRAARAGRAAAARGRSMKTAFAAALLVLSLALPGGAADKPLTPQQEKMKACNSEASTKGMNGADRKKFMSSCLKADASAAGGTEKALTPQQEKMKSCNTEATSKGLKGEDRKKFMSTCLKAG
jgi:psiF repeat-containing protein